jgi:hypothetical protein
MVNVAARRPAAPALALALALGLVAVIAPAHVPGLVPPAM